MPKITELTPQDLQKLKNKTPLSLPDNPSSKGFSASQIKEKMSGGCIYLFEKLQTTIKELNDYIDSNDVDIITINTTITGINMVLTQLQSQVSALGITDTNIENQISQINSLIQEIQDEINHISIEGDFATKDEVNARFSRLSDLIRDAVEIAEGKTKTYVLSYEFTIPSDEELSTSLNYYDGEGNTIKSSQDILNYLGEEWSLNDLVNSNFNSQENSIGLVSANSNGTRGFICVEVEGKMIFSKVADNDKQFPLFKTGDIILVKETDVPDRWYTYNVAYKMETTKVDLNAYYTKGEINTLVEDYRDIKEISTQYVRIWDLDVGIYKLTYNGTKYIYHNGATSSANTSIPLKGTCLLFITDLTDGDNKQKYWYTNVSTNEVNLGVTTSTFGLTYRRCQFSGVKDVNGMKQSSTASIYAPTTAGSSGQVLISNGSGAPVWTNIKTLVETAFDNGDLEGF